MYNSTWKGTHTNSSNDWDDSVATKYNNWIVANYSNGSWNITLPNLNPISNSKLYVWVIAKDSSGNETLKPSSTQIDNNLNYDNSPAYWFGFDSSTPTTSTTYPDKFAINLPTDTFSGTAFDPDAGSQPSGLYEVRIAFRRSDGSYYKFTTSDWSAGPNDNFGVTGLSNWTRGILTTSQEDGYQYDIITMARDNAGNNFNYSVKSTFTFIVDLTTPTSVVTFPANNSFLSGASAITGSADDSVENLRGYTEPGRTYESGIASTGVLVALQRLSDNKWWDGSSFASEGMV